MGLTKYKSTDVFFQIGETSGELPQIKLKYKTENERIEPGSYRW